MCESVQAATPFTETFSSGTAAWLKTGAWQLFATNQALLGRFQAQGVPLPESGSWVATNSSSGGAYVGNYSASGIGLIGFSFMAQDVLPSAALLRWQAATSSFFRSFAAQVTQTGVWYRFAFSLRSKDAGKWVGSSGVAFTQALLDVKGLEFQITRGGMAAQRYYLDDVFVDELPVGDQLETTNGIAIQWASLRPGVVYAVQKADHHPSNGWAAAGSFTNTGVVHLWQDVTFSNAARRFYRLGFNEQQP
jgi:hypothetical protein